ncbi:hypothetical protein OE88DRAFT_1154199 [Heliocybe sulcata]|uniref:Uncharacterized protein n=1 Tax=Heliocybe sulcata TaxID=5364 RepID=A0A5C3NAT9_9AGAM|nr:hypothetical protein OE88DRAFT_1154199 [Heliocybe sulcata]
MSRTWKRSLRDHRVFHTTTPLMEGSCPCKQDVLDLQFTAVPAEWILLCPRWTKRNRNFQMNPALLLRHSTSEGFPGTGAIRRLSRIAALSAQLSSSGLTLVCMAVVFQSRCAALAALRLPANVQPIRGINFSSRIGHLSRHEARSSLQNRRFMRVTKTTPLLLPL